MALDSLPHFNHDLISIHCLMVWISCVLLICFAVMLCIVLFTIWFTDREVDEILLSPGGNAYRD